MPVHRAEAERTCGCDVVEVVRRSTFVRSISMPFTITRTSWIFLAQWVASWYNADCTLMSRVMQPRYDEHSEVYRRSEVPIHVRISAEGMRQCGINHIGTKNCRATLTPRVNRNILFFDTAKPRIVYHWRECRRRIPVRDISGERLNNADNSIRPNDSP